MRKDSKRRWVRPPSPAMIVALVALVVAMGGTSYAAGILPASSVGTKQLKSNAVTNAKVKDGAVTGAKVRDGSLTGADIDVATLGKVPSAASADTAGTATSVAAGAVGPGQLGAIPAARVRANAPQTIPSGGTVTTISFDTVAYDTGTLYDAGSPKRLTAHVAGKYLVVGSASWTTNAAGERSLSLFKNGAQFADDITNGNAVEGPAHQVVGTVALAAGDYVELGAYQNSGISLNAAAYNPGAVLDMVWLAP